MKALKTIFAIIGVLALLVGGTFFALARMPSNNEFKIQESLTSEDMKYIAMRYTGMGGGAAGWCRQYVSVALAGAKITPSVEYGTDQYQVFSINCSSNFSVKWNRKDELQIILVEPPPGERISASMAGTDASGNVHISYVLPPNPSLQADAPDGPRPELKR